ncbi:MAG: hypothetical protein KGZ25_02865, partial [Planctomycetes bacterium]|nr:hypothetical protein [Planctomycetota bacterium]
MDGRKRTVFVLSGLIVAAALLAVYWGCEMIGKNESSKSQRGEEEELGENEADAAEQDSAGRLADEGKTSVGVEEKREEMALRSIPEVRTSREGKGGQVESRSEVGRHREQGPPLGNLEEPGDKVLIDDFEHTLFWRPVAWENANDCEISLVERGEGRVLLLVCGEGDHEKAGARLEFGTGVDVSDFKAVTLKLSS